MHARKLGQRVARQERFDPRLEPGGGQRERHEFHAGDPLRRDRQSPARRDVRFGGQEPGLFEQFPARARLKIHPIVEDVVRIRRSGGKIDLAGVVGVVRHLAKQKRPVVRAQRSHREAIVDRFAGMAEIAPGEEVGIVGLEIDALEPEHSVGARSRSRAGREAARGR